MNRKFVWLSLIAVAALAGVYVVSANPAAPAVAIAIAANKKEFKVDAYKFYFSPDIITVNKGDKVKIIINNADILHGIRIPELDVRGNESVEFTADKIGEFVWYCNTYCGDGHKQMQGKLIIQ
jgi:cytochrome c oxidase subunit 2